MPHADFVHLRAHSAYSLSEGAIKMAELVRLCGEARMPAVALTDSGNLFGVMEFSLAAAEAGLQPIAGMLFKHPHRDLRDRTRLAVEEGGRGKLHQVVVAGLI